MFEYGWAYSYDGNAAREKGLICAVSCGNDRDAYAADGFSAISVSSPLPADCRFLWHALAPAFRRLRESTALEDHAASDATFLGALAADHLSPASLQ